MVSAWVIALMWALAISLFALRRNQKDKTIVLAAVVFALAATAQEPTFYSTIDSFLGGRNLVRLIGSISFMIGAYLLSRALSSTRTWTRARKNAERIILGFAIAVAIGSFLLIPMGDGTAADFILEYGHTHQAAMHSSTQFIYIGYVLVILGVVASQTLRNAAAAYRERIAAVFLLIGSVLGVMLSGAITYMNVENASGHIDVVLRAAPYVKALNGLAVLFLVVGAGYTPLVRWMTQKRWDFRTARLLREVTPLWEDATTARPSLRLATDAASSELRLHRRIVEIRDAEMDRRNSFTLDTAQQKVLASAEGHLMAGRA